MKNTTAFRPNKGKYLVLPNPVESLTTKIEGSEYTIESQKDIHAKPSEGTVVACGAECTQFGWGAKVLYGRFSGYEQLFDGTNYLILAETEILGERIVTPFDDPKFAYSPEFCDGEHTGQPCHPTLCWMKNPL